MRPGGRGREIGAFVCHSPMRTNEEGNRQRPGRDLDASWRSAVCTGPAGRGRRGGRGEGGPPANVRRGPTQPLRKAGLGIHMSEPILGVVSSFGRRLHAAPPPPSPPPRPQVLEYNKRIQAQNRVPREFPWFVREGFDVKIVADDFEISPDGWGAPNFARPPNNSPRRPSLPASPTFWDMSIVLPEGAAYRQLSSTGEEICRALCPPSKGSDSPALRPCAGW